MTPGARLNVMLGGIAAAAIVLPLAIVRHAPAIPRDLPLPASQREPAVPHAVVPPVEPVAYRAVTPEDALAWNASVPFSTDPNPAAKPFRFAGSDTEREKATDCLAAALWYEAGDDASGERAVAQVVLNRLRHPAFPKTVCGVVFQGQERSTGCQFTFTCDGALSRTPSQEAWSRARDLAAKALAGGVDRRVGHATHYHTDWVVPYWSGSLDKIVAVGTHLFFRWAGWWGTPPAFRFGQSGAEPVIAALARLSPVHAGAASPADSLLAEGIALAVTGTRANAVPGDPDSFVAMLDPRQAPDTYRTLALATCGDRVRCKFLGWTDPATMPAAPPFTPAQLDAMAFSYLRDRGFGFERALWNCTLFPRQPAAACMRRAPVTIAAPAPVVSPVPTIAAPLAGVRHRAAPVTPPRTSPAATPSPTPRPPRSADAAIPPPA